MRYILVMVLGLMVVFLIGNTTALAVNAKSCGAKGDGIQDDSRYLNAAIAKALTLGESLFIPAGTYKCNQLDAYSKILKMDQPGVKTIVISGEPGTIITTSQQGGVLFYIFNKNINVTIQNIFFQNTHGITTSQTGAIQLLGTNENSIHNFMINGCRFEGFSTAITAQGVQGMIIQNNIFASPKGHDNAQNNSQPAVFIWLADNSNGQCYNVKIQNNSANGFTGTDISQTVTKRPMDGFVYGTAYGLTIQGNLMRNLCEENIAVSPQSLPSANYAVLITKNNFYLNVPVGSMKDGEPLIANYGIRADCNNVTVSNNNFYDFTLGILILPMSYPTLKQHGYHITGNTFYSTRSSLYHVRETVKIQATPENPATDIIVSGNTVSISDIELKSNRSIISLYDCNKIAIENNQISGQNISLNGFSMSWLLTLDCLNLVNLSNIITFK